MGPGYPAHSEDEHDIKTCRASEDVEFGMEGEREGQMARSPLKKFALEKMGSTIIGMEPNSRA